MNLMEVYGLKEIDTTKMVYDLITSESPAKAIEMLVANKKLTEAQKLCIAYNVGQYEITMQIEPNARLLHDLIANGRCIRLARKLNKEDRDKLIEEEFKTGNVTEI